MSQLEDFRRCADQVRSIALSPPHLASFQMTIMELALERIADRCAPDEAVEIARIALECAHVMPVYGFEPTSPVSERVRFDVWHHVAIALSCFAGVSIAMILAYIGRSLLP